MWPTQGKLGYKHIIPFRRQAETTVYAAQIYTNAGALSSLFQYFFQSIYLVDNPHDIALHLVDAFG